MADAASQGAALAVLPVNSVNDHQLLSDDVVTRVNTFGRNVERSGPPPARSRRRGRRAAP